MMEMKLDTRIIKSSQILLLYQSFMTPYNITATRYGLFKCLDDFSFARHRYRLAVSCYVLFSRV